MTQVIFGFVFLSFVLCLILLLVKRFRRMSLACGTAAVCALVGFGTPLFTAPMLRWIQSGDEAPVRPASWAPESTIIVLGMGTSKISDTRYEVAPLSFGRIAAAATSFRACQQSGAHCRVLVTGGGEGQGDDEAKVYASELMSLGVPKVNILLERRSKSTWENAKFSKELIDQLPPGQIYLVTSAVHMRRALIYFRYWGMNPTPIRADSVEPWPTLIPMAFNVALADLVLSEITGIVRFNVYNAFGWNEAPTLGGKHNPSSLSHAVP